MEFNIPEHIKASLNITIRDRASKEIERIKKKLHEIERNKNTIDIDYIDVTNERKLLKQ